jgi:hypothetical protein
VLSPRYATPLRLSINHSPRLRAIFIFFSLLCIVALLLAQMHVWLKLFLLIVLAAVGITTWRKRPELGGDTVELILRPNGAWLLQRPGSEEKLRLLGESVLSHAVTILVFSGDGGGRQYILWRREMPEDIYRRLQVYLRLYGGEGVE